MGICDWPKTTRDKQQNHQNSETTLYTFRNIIIIYYPSLHRLCSRGKQFIISSRVLEMSKGS